MEAFVKTFERDRGRVRRRCAVDRGSTLQRGAAAWTAGLLLALAGVRAARPAMAKPHPHVDKPASVAAASDPGEPDQNKHEAVTGGDTKKVIHWQVKDPPADPVNLGEYKKSHAKKVSYVSVSRGGAGPHPNKLFRASYDGKVIVSTLNDFTNAGFITYYDEHSSPSTTADMEVWCVAASQDGVLAVSSTNFGEIKLWKADDGTTLGTVPGETSFYPVGGLAFLPPVAGRNNQFLAAHADGNVILYEIVPPPANPPGQPHALNPVRTFSHQNELAVNSVAVTSDGAIAVSGGFDMTVRIWDVAAGTQTKEIEDNKNIVWRVAISPNNQRIATASDDGTVRLYSIDGRPLIDPMTQQPAVRDESAKGGIMGVAFVTNDKVVYTAPDQSGLDAKVWKINGFNPAANPPPPRQ
jgi:WD40 repeat protein